MKPHTLDCYQDKYESITLERDDDGVLLIRLHSPDDASAPLVYGDRPYGWGHPHVEWSHCFNDVARDYDNEVVIITGTGDSFIGKHAAIEPDGESVGKTPPVDPRAWDVTFTNGKFVEMNLLNISVPVIAAVNGPAYTHAELAVLADIVLASETADFQDHPHFKGGVYVPGDSVALVWPMLLGENRGREFLLTGRKISAAEAKDIGFVSEVLPPDQLLARAYEHAREILKRPKLVRRYTRVLMVQRLQRLMHEHIGYGLALEGLGAAGRDYPG
jgi:enoyl-CoA hydratase/carnithine racemase